MGTCLVKLFWSTQQLVMLTAGSTLYTEEMHSMYKVYVLFYSATHH